MLVGQERVVTLSRDAELQLSCHSLRCVLQFCRMQSWSRRVTTCGMCYNFAVCKVKKGHQQRSRVKTTATLSLRLTGGWCSTACSG